MEEPEKACHKQDKQKKMVINMGKGGGGGLGGIIFLAGLLATAAALTLKRRLQKSNKDEKINHQNPLPDETLDSSNSDESTKGLQILVSDFPPQGHHQLSKGITRAALSRTSLNCSILNYEKMPLEIDGGKREPISNAEEVLIRSFPRKVASKFPRDDSMIKKEEISPKIDNLLHFEPGRLKKHVPEIASQAIEHHDASEATLVDELVTEDAHDMEAHSDREQVEEEQDYDGEISEVKCKALEITTGSCASRKIQLDEQQAAGEEITVDCLIKEAGDFDEKQLSPPLADNLSFDRNVSTQIGDDELIKSEDTFEVAEGDRIKDGADLTLNEKQVESFDQQNDEITIEKCNEAGEIWHAEQIALVDNEVEITLNDQPSPESYQDGDSGTKVLISSEAHDDLCHFEPRNMNYNCPKTNQQPTDHIKVIEENVAKESIGEGMVEEGGNTTIQIQMIEERESEDDDRNGVGKIAEAPEIISVCIVMAEDDPVRGMSDGPENVNDNGVDDCDDDDDNDDNNNIIAPEADQLARMSDEAEKPNGYEINDDIVMAEDDQIAQTGDEVEIAQDNEIDDNNDDNNNIVAAEDDENDHYNEDGGEDEVDTAEIVESSSEGTGDSSAESNAGEIWPAGTIQELSMSLKDINKLNHQKEGRNSNEGETIQAEGNISYKCVKAGDNITSGINPISDSNGKWRIIIGVVSVLLLSLCFRHIGAPLMKLSIVMILVKILSRARGI